jgi:hypothetical protein
VFQLALSNQRKQKYHQKGTCNMTHRAWIIDFKKSKKRMGYYYPVFEYANEDGMTRQFISSICREKTPFTICQPYRLRKIGYGVYEKEEMQIAPRCYWTAFALILMIVSLFGLRLMLSSICIAVLAISINNVCKILKIDKMQKIAHQTEPIEGKVIGCQRRRYRHIDGVMEDQFYPVIEYEYQGEIYQHVSSRQDDRSDELGTVCNIYIDAKKRIVCDSYEANTSISSVILPRIYIPKFKKPAANQRAQEQYKIPKNAPPLPLRTHDVSPGRKRRSA